MLNLNRFQTAHNRRFTGDRLRLLIGLCLSLSLATTANAEADPLNQSIDTRMNNQQQESRSQQRIDQLDDETRVMLDDYQRLSKELELLTVYNDQLQRVIHSQEQEKVSIRQQMADLERTQREVVPLMLRMVDGMKRFIDIDQPFLPDERHLRVEQLLTLMDRADVSIGEKYRRVLEAYQVEMEYGRTIEAYRGELKAASTTRTVDFLRVGRIGLYYQTLDRLEVGQWNGSSGNWEVLPDHYGMAIRKGLRIAHNQAAPDLLRLPVPAATSVAAGEVTP